MENFTTKIVVKFETPILRSVKFLRISCRFLSKVEKYRTAEQATDDNMEHANFTRGSSGYKYTLKYNLILIAFPRQQYMHECALTIRYTYSFCLVYHLLLSGAFYNAASA
jgi:hypothetical protein